MIVVTPAQRDSQFAVNPDLIERIHANPDTTLVMVDGAKYIVSETMDEVIELIANYRAYVITHRRGHTRRTMAAAPPASRKNSTLAPPHRPCDSSTTEATPLRPNSQGAPDGSGTLIGSSSPSASCCR